MVDHYTHGVLTSGHDNGGHKAKLQNCCYAHKLALLLSRSFLSLSLSPKRCAHIPTTKEEHTQCCHAYLVDSRIIFSSPVHTKVSLNLSLSAGLCARRYGQARWVWISGTCGHRATRSRGWGPRSWYMKCLLVCAIVDSPIALTLRIEHRAKAIHLSAACSMV